MDKIPIAGLLPDEMESALHLSPAFRARQVFQWVARGAASFDQMTNLSKPLRAGLADIAAVRTVSVNQSLTDEDGTVKLQLRLSDGAMVESVIMTERESGFDTFSAQGSSASSTENTQPPVNRRTVCISTQVGCACACAFCMTGTLGLVRNLEAHEIVEQFLVAEGGGFDTFLSKDVPRYTAATVVTAAALGNPDIVAKTLNHQMVGIDNVVLMGMGEPLMNLAAVRKALAVLSDPRGRALSLRRVTLSTSGIISGIDDLAANGPHVRLAVSLTTADEDLRRQLMPVARNNPLADLRRAIAGYAEASGRRVTLEAAMLRGVNTGGESARRMIDFARGLDVNINLIPWNAVPGLPFTAPSADEVRSFVSTLQEAGLNVTVRAHHGRSVAAACGQLGGKQW